ncbi:MAG TPA: hypothetical protein VE978_16045 [Chitinophagales bacterium]|nr:hypothetical protein [Chitinophagales bacterium]
MTAAKQKYEFNEMQGLIKRGYGTKKFTDFILLKIEDAVKAKQWLKLLIPQLSDATADKFDPAINVAFTHAGLDKLGLTAHIQNNFLREFQEGMADETRSRLLGDYDWDKQVSIADSWEWKDAAKDVTDGNVIDVLLMVYASAQQILDATYSRVKQEASVNGVREFKRLLTKSNDFLKEHFGFHDGISQPTIKDFSDRTDDEDNTINAGEFVLGYSNQYDICPESPEVRSPVTNEVFDFGRNGTYLVMRQMEQDVKGFWDFIASQSKDDSNGSVGKVDEGAAVFLASRMVGRWPGGTPVATCPDADPGKETDENKFLYHSVAPEHFGKCPVGSHVLRSNPRDFLGTNKKESIKLSNHHRILRRGRSYGKPLVDSMQCKDFLCTPNDNEERGLYFMCLNTNISRQFEFIQHTWINNEKFNGMYNDTDHIAGSYPGDFTIPQSPVRRHITNIPVFVRVRGGAYFFLPSISALKFLSEL